MVDGGFELTAMVSPWHVSLGDLAEVNYFPHWFLL